MMLVPDDEVPKVTTPPVVTDPMIEDVPEDVPGFDPPPAYVESRAPPNIGTSTLPSSPLLRSKPTNNIYVSRSNQSIKGSFVLDPCMTIPRLLLPPLCANEMEGDRKNLKLHARNGSIDVDVTLLSSTESLSLSGAKRKKRTALDIKSDNGGIDARLRAYATSTSGVLAPFKLKVTGRNGSVNVGLPCEFEGLLTISTKNGSVKFSDEVSDRVSMFTEDNYTQRCFIGNINLLGDGNWKGDEVNIEALNGRVKVYLTDQVEPAASNYTPGFLSRVWGMAS